MPYRGPGVAYARPLYRPGYADRRRGADEGRRYRPWIGSGYGYGYPGWLGYPYVIDPGFYDWGSAGDAQALAPNYADAPQYPAYDAPPEGPGYPAYASPYPPHGYVAQQPNAAAIAPPGPVMQEPLTVMFKSGRTPATMQNYMLSSRTLTDLDRQHYEQIPLDQIDVAATEHANRTRGVDFEIPAEPQK